MVIIFFADLLFLRYLFSLNIQVGFIKFTHWEMILQILTENGAIWVNLFLI